MPSVYDAENFIGRVNYAAQCFVRKTTGTRHFDTCFEMADGDAVVAALVRRAEKNPKLKAAIVSCWPSYGGEYAPSWKQAAGELKHVPTRKLREAAREQRQRFDDRHTAAEVPQ